MYVALSRCTSLEGLILTSPINQQFLGAHQNLEEWKQNNQDEKNLQEKFAESRKNHIQQELQNIFTWSNWADELRDLNTLLNEHKDDLPAESFTWINELTGKQKELAGDCRQIQRKDNDALRSESCGGGEFRRCSSVLKMQRFIFMPRF